MKNVLLIYGGGGSEHDVSLITAKYILSQLDKKALNIIEVLAITPSVWECQNQKVQLNFNKELIGLKNKISIDYAIPCFHGAPGETGQIQAYFDMINLPFLGPSYEASTLCFNKVSTKLWMEKTSIPNTPFLVLADKNAINTEEINDFYDHFGPLFIKAASQGSSVGCYWAKNKQDIQKYVNEAFNYSEQVIIEKTISGRELEISTFEFRGEIHATLPGEIICPDKFYDYQEKYAENSKTKTVVTASDIDPGDVKLMQEYAKKLFHIFKLKDLSRIDFFYTDEKEILINEINTFPGMTPISMFPKMMEASGVSFTEFIRDRIQ